MGKLMESISPVATDLLRRTRRQKQAVDGFEFKFTRDDESVAWYTELSVETITRS